MTTLILSSIGSTVGSTLGPLGAMAGSYLGTSIGSYFDRKIFDLNKTQKISGYRLDDLAIQTSTYGKTIPIIFGSMRVSGNIIWSMPIKEVISTELISQSYGKGFSQPKATVENTQYNYFINVAIGICEGVIDDIERIWADNKILDKTKLNFRLYRGTEDQMPDSLIQSVEGIENTPGYRGLAYIVIEDFQINEFGNRVPNFTFEVKRNLIDEDSVESKITGVNIIPGSGEFVYDTITQYKSNIAQFGKFQIIDQKKERINNNTESSDADAIVALNQMQKTLPNLKYVSVVVSWFANSLDLKNCQIYPAVEGHEYTTSPDEWRVKNLTRSQAKIVTKDANGNPIYGGTVSDQSLIRYLQKLKSSGYKVILYPMLFLDLKDKPWRGKIKGSDGDVEKFFGSSGKVLFSDENNNTNPVILEPVPDKVRGSTENNPQLLNINNTLSTNVTQDILRSSPPQNVILAQAGIQEELENKNNVIPEYSRGIQKQEDSVGNSNNINNDKDGSPITNRYATEDDNLEDKYVTEDDSSTKRNTNTNSKATTTNTFSYFEFITHYATITKDYIDGIIIGSELKGITLISNATKIYPAIDKLIELSNIVRQIIEPKNIQTNAQTRNKIITYAADWSEYHSVNGEYNLDKLWASEDINVVGIDAYFPLTDIKSYSYTPKLNEIVNGWTSGEGYDYFYENGNRDKKIYYNSPEFAWKNIQYWWENEHINSTDKVKSLWKSRMKKIWFTEYGFPSIHAATNMPNVFYNPESSDGGLPVNSNGGINFDLQRVAIEATIQKWRGSRMVENMMLWCYDARPYPQFPQDRNIWADGNLWTYGHWVNGKLGRCLLAKILSDLFYRVVKVNGELGRRNNQIIQSSKVLPSLASATREGDLPSIISDELSKDSFPIERVNAGNDIIKDNNTGSPEWLASNASEDDNIFEAHGNIINKALKQQLHFLYANLNTENIFQSVDGFIINNNITILDAFKILQQCYFFDVKENEYSVTFIPRGNSEILEIPYKHITLNKTQTQISISKNDQLSLPTSVNLNFISKLDDYEVRNVNVSNDHYGIKMMQRLQTTNHNNLGIDVPIVMNPDYGHCVAQVILSSAHYQREQYEFSLPLWYSHLEPGDVIKLEIQPNIHRTIRILNIIHSTYIKIQGIIDDQTLYYFRQGDSLLISQSNQKPQKISETIFVYGVIPPLNNEMNGSIIFACSGAENNWKGATILQTNSSGKLEPVVSIGQRGNFGVLLNEGIVFKDDGEKNTNNINNTTELSSSDVLLVNHSGDPLCEKNNCGFPDYTENDNININAQKIISSNPLFPIASYHIPDTKNTLYIFMTSGQLESIQDQEFYGNANTALLGKEMIQFKNAELIGNNIYKLTCLRRGLFGTEYYINNHTEKENFILIDDKIGKIELKENDAGVSKKFKIISFGDSIKNYTEQIVNCDIFSYLYNYSICNLKASISDGQPVGTKFLNLSWNKRTRTNGEWLNFRDIIDYEKDEIYEIKIINSDSNQILETKILNKPEYQHKITVKNLFILIYKISSTFGKTYGVKYKIDGNNGNILSDEVISNLF